MIISNDNHWEKIAEVKPTCKWSGANMIQDAPKYHQDKKIYE